MNKANTRLLEILKLSNVFDFWITKDGKVFSNAHPVTLSLLQDVFDQYKQYIDHDIRLPNYYSYLFKFNLQNKNILLIIEVSNVIHGYYFENQDQTNEAFVNQIEIVKPYLHKYISCHKETYNLKNYKNITYLKNEPLSGNVQDNNITLFLRQLKLCRYSIRRKDGESLLLSPKQSQLMIAIVQGLSYLQIEKVYNIRKRAAELYLTHIKLKTGWNNRSELIREFLSMNPWIVLELQSLN